MKLLGEEIDANHHGMPDYWEDKNKLDKMNAWYGMLSVERLTRFRKKSIEFILTVFEMKCKYIKL